MDNIPLVCPVCHQSVVPEWYFCPNCGKELKAKLVRVSAATQIGIYALSVFLPPLGLWPGIKYLGKKGREAKIVGAIAIVLTIISSVVTTWLTFRYLQSYLAIYSGLINSNGLDGL
jgi:uncharacterized OB-fold protein